MTGFMMQRGRIVVCGNAGPALAEFEEDSQAIGAWLRGGQVPDFPAIAERLLALHATLVDRGWYVRTEAVSAALERLESARDEGRGDDLRAVERGAGVEEARVALGVGLRGVGGVAGALGILAPVPWAWSATNSVLAPTTDPGPAPDPHGVWDPAADAVVAGLFARGEVEDVNALLKQFKMVQGMMKQFAGAGGKKGRFPKMPNLGDFPGM